jgi:hypothetical protein
VFFWLDSDLSFFFFFFFFLEDMADYVERTQLDVELTFYFKK